MPTDTTTTPPPPATPTMPPLAVRAVEAARLVGVARSSWDRLVAAGQAPAPIKLGGLPVWRTDELREWLAAGAPDRATWEARRDVG